LAMRSMFSQQSFEQMARNPLAGLQ
jgi:hypothetical protein